MVARHCEFEVTVLLCVIPGSNVISQTKSYLVYSLRASMSAFQRAIASNNHGVKLLESNDTLLAMAVFQGGIQMIKECGYNHIKQPHARIRRAE